jgi:hypothetical protein
MPELARQFRHAVPVFGVDKVYLLLNYRNSGGQHILFPKWFEVPLKNIIPA